MAIFYADLCRQALVAGLVNTQSAEKQDYAPVEQFRRGQNPLIAEQDHWHLDEIRPAIRRILFGAAVFFCRIGVSIQNVFLWGPAGKLGLSF